MPETWSAQIDAFYRAVVLPPLRLDPPQVPAEHDLTLLAPLLWFDGRIHESMSCIRLIELRQQVDSDTLLLRGFWQLYLGRSDEAMETFATVLSRDPASTWAQYGRAYARLYVHDYDGAAADFEELAAKSPELEGAKVMAAASRALAAGRPPDEIRMPPLPDLPPGVSEVLQMQLLDGPDAAVAHGFASLESLSAESRFPLSRLLIGLLLEVGVDDRAVTLLRAAADDRPGDGLLAYYRGIALRRAGDANESHEWFRMAVESAPLEARVWAGYGAGMLERDELAESAKAYRTALFLDDRNANAWGELGTVYAKMKDFGAAVDALTHAIDLGARTFANYVNGGLCVAELGSPDRAILDWSAAVELDPTHPNAPRLREVIEHRDSTDGAAFVFGDLD